MVSKFKVKVDQEKVLKCLELLNYLIKTTTQQVGEPVAVLGLAPLCSMALLEYSGDFLLNLN